MKTPAIFSRMIKKLPFIILVMVLVLFSPSPALAEPASFFDTDLANRTQTSWALEKIAALDS